MPIKNMKNLKNGATWWMTFKSYCYESWLEYMDECLSYNQAATNYKDWFRQNRWYLRKMYRFQYGALQPPYTPPKFPKEH